MQTKFMVGLVFIIFQLILLLALLYLKNKSTKTHGLSTGGTTTSDGGPSTKPTENPCRTSEWTNWSNCSKLCNGSKSRTRENLTPSNITDSQCIVNLKEDISCNTTCPPVSDFSGLIGWYDETSHDICNNVVVGWKDKSSNSRYLRAQSTYSGQAITIEKINLLNAFLFNGGYRLFVRQEPEPKFNSHQATFIFVLSFKNTTNMSNIFSSAGGWSTKGEIHVILSNETPKKINLAVNMIGKGESTSFIPQINTPYILIIDIETIKGISSVRINGTVYTAGTYNSADISSNPPPLLLDNFAIGGWDTFPDGRNFPGSIGEVILYNKLLTLEQKEYIEGYLAKKWFTTNPLPGIHPYYE